MSLLEKLFLFFLLIIYPLGELTRFTIAPPVSFHLVDLAVFAIFFVWLFQKKKIFLKANLFIPIIVFIAIATLSLILNWYRYTQTELFVSFLYIVRWIIYAGIYFAILSFSDSFKKKIPYFILISSFLIVIYGISQYFIFPDLRPLYDLGWDEHLFRLFSVYLDPNLASVILVFIFSFSLALFLKESREGNIRNKIGVLTILSLISVFLTYSRAGILMLFVSVGVFLFLINRKKIFLIFLFSSIAIIFMLPNVSEGTNFLRSASITARMESVERGLLVFKENPVFGVGYNGYRYIQQDKGYLGKDWKTSHSASGVENSYVFLLATTGIFGFAAYLFLLSKIILSSFKNKKKTIFSTILLSSVIGLMINALFINSLFYSFILIWFWILAGITESS